MIKIGIIAGDGVGPEVIAESLKVLARVAELEGLEYQLQPVDIGGERYLKTGEVLPDAAVRELRAVDAILLGAVGHPQVPPGVLEKGILLRLRFDFHQYINLRPVRLFVRLRTRRCPLMPREFDWTDTEEIGIQLQEKFPELDPYTVRFTDLHKWVTELPGFIGDPAKSNEGLLEAIQTAWHEEYEDAKS